MPDPSEPLSREVLDAIQGGRLPPAPPPLLPQLPEPKSVEREAELVAP